MLTRDMFVVANLFVIISVASTSSAQAILSYLFPLAPSVFPRSLQKLERPSLLKHEYNRTDCVVGIIQCDSCYCIIGDLVYFVRYIVFVG